jgi:hypothetical protein
MILRISLPGGRPGVVEDCLHGPEIKERLANRSASFAKLREGSRKNTGPSTANRSWRSLTGSRLDGRQPFPNPGKAENGVTSRLTVIRPQPRNQPDFQSPEHTVSDLAILGQLVLGSASLGDQVHARQMMIEVHTVSIVAKNTYAG